MKDNLRHHSVAFASGAQGTGQLAHPASGASLGAAAATGGEQPAPQGGGPQVIVRDVLWEEDRRRLGLWGAVSVLIVVALWEWGAQSGMVSSLYLPPPTAVARELWSMIRSGELWNAVAASLYRILWGFLVGTAAGIVVGLAVGVSRLFEAVLDPLIALTYPVPKIAILPLVILWLGIGEASKVAIIAIGVFFPVCINTLAGVREADPLLIKAAVSLGASRWQVLTKVVFISALPMMFAGLRLGAGMALLLVVSAEMIAASAGLGFLILHAGDLLLTRRLMAGIVVLSFLGLASTWLLRGLERLVIPWKES